MLAATADSTDSLYTAVNASLQTAPVSWQCQNSLPYLSGSFQGLQCSCLILYDIQLDNLEGDLKILGSAASDLGISFYKDVNGPLREVTQTASNMVTQLNDAYKSGGMIST